MRKVLLVLVLTLALLGCSRMRVLGGADAFPQLAPEQTLDTLEANTWLSRQRLRIELADGRHVRGRNLALCSGWLVWQRRGLFLPWLTPRDTVELAKVRALRWTERRMSGLIGFMAVVVLDAVLPGSSPGIGHAFVVVISAMGADVVGMTFFPWRDTLLIDPTPQELVRLRKAAQKNRPARAEPVWP